LSGSRIWSRQGCFGKGRKEKVVTKAIPGKFFGEEREEERGRKGLAVEVRKKERQSSLRRRNGLRDSKKREVLRGGTKWGT